MYQMRYIKENSTHLTYKKIKRLSLYKFNFVLSRSKDWEFWEKPKAIFNHENTVYEDKS